VTYLDRLLMEEFIDPLVPQHLNLLLTIEQKMHPKPVNGIPSVCHLLNLMKTCLANKGIDSKNGSSDPLTAT